MATISGHEGGGRRCRTVVARRRAPGSGQGAGTMPSIGVLMISVGISTGRTNNTRAVQTTWARARRRPALAAAGARHTEQPRATLPFHLGGLHPASCRMHACLPTSADCRLVVLGTNYLAGGRDGRPESYLSLITNPSKSSFNNIKARDSANSKIFCTPETKQMAMTCTNAMAGSAVGS